MKNRHPFLRILLLIAFAAHPFAAPAGPADEAQALLENAIEEYDLVGLSAAVGRDGEIVWSGAAGYADLENELPATPQMVHRIASISKPMAAVATMRLVEDGILDLDGDLRAYYEEYPEKPWGVTIRHLLSHTSGTRHYNEGEAGTMSHYVRLKHAAEVFQDDDLLFEPGTAYEYTTYGYTLLGCAIEAASGKWFKDVMQAHVWDPAGMTATRLEERQDVVPNRARGYTLHWDKSIKNAPYTDLSIKYPGGGIVSSVEDLVRFGMAFNAGELVKPETVETMLTPVTLPDGATTNYGLGWGVGDHKTYGPRISHSGGQAGTTTLLVVFRDSGVAIALIANRDGAPGTRETLDALAGLFAAEPAVAD